ncbi:MAG: PAS domain S-box protein [Isosphaeraceae bacterium]
MKHTHHGSAAVSDPDLGLLIEAALGRHHLRDLADHLPQLVWTCLPDGRCDFLNRRWVEYTGVPEVEHHEYGWVEALHPDDRPFARALWDRFIAGEAEYDLEYRLRRRDGAYRWFKARGLLIREADGSPRRIFGTTTDIDDQKRAESELRENRERLEAALAASGTGTFRWDITTNALDWDEQLDRLFGLAPGEAVRSLDQFVSLVHPEDRVAVLERCARCRDDGDDFSMEFRVVWRDGSVRWLDDRGKTFRGPDGRPAYMTGACVDITDRRGAEDRLRESEARSRDILESITDAFFAVEGDWRFAYVNHRAEEMLARSPGDLIGKVIWDEFPGLDGSEFEAMYRKVARDRVTGSVTAYYPDHGRWYETHGFPAARGGITVYFRNATERIRAQREIARLAEGQRLALDAAGLGSWHIDLATSELTTDERLRAIFGVDDERLDYETALGLIHPEDRDRVRASVAAATNPDDPRPYSDEHRVIRPDGTVRWVHAVGRARFTGEGAERRLTSFDGTIADVTERRATEAAVREGERRLRAAHDLLEGITEGTEELIAALDPQFRYTVVNAAYRRDFRRVFGTEARVGGSMIEALAHLPEDQKNAVALWARALAGENVSETMEFGDPGRERRVFDLRFSPIRAAGGQVIGAAEIARDVTDRVRAEEALKDADRRKDEFLATLAHELRNPLAPLRNGLQVMRLAGSNAEMAAAAREIMERQLAHMVRLVDDLLDISRVTSGKLELRRAVVPLSDVVAGAIETARPAIEAGGHSLDLSLPPKPLVLDVDLTRLAQVFSNLLTNAARYTAPGGHIRISAESSAGWVAVRVSDDGIGIPAGELPRIFEMFSQVDRSVERATGGLGIGLALVKGLVEMHGGTVSAESPGEGRGSTFTVRLPLAGSPALRPEDAPEGDASGGTPSRRILVVDDNGDAASSLSTLLGLLGHTVATVHDGLAAVEAAERLRPELILMDVGMPKLNGYDATRRIRERPWGRSVTIVALTGWGQENDRALSTAAGCDGHLTKPVDLEEIEKFLSARRPG